MNKVKAKILAEKITEQITDYIKKPYIKKEELRAELQDEIVEVLSKNTQSKPDCQCTSKLAAFQEQFGKVKKLSISKILAYAEENLNLLIVPGFSRPFIINEVGYRLQEKYVGLNDAAKKNHIKTRKQLLTAMKKGA